MGIYSYLEQSLGIKPTPRLKEVKEKIEKGEVLPPEDMAYLLDNAARYTTLKHYKSEDKLKLNREYDDVAYEIGELLGDILTELDAVFYSSVDKNGHYHLNFDQVLTGGRNDLRGIKDYVARAVDTVHAYQDTFKKADNGLTVIGQLSWLEKTFKIECQVTATDTFDSIWKMVSGRLRVVFEYERKLACENLDYLNT